MKKDNIEFTTSMNWVIEQDDDHPMVQYVKDHYNMKIDEFTRLIPVYALENAPFTQFSGYVSQYVIKYELTSEYEIKTGILVETNFGRMYHIITFSKFPYEKNKQLELYMQDLYSASRVYLRSCIIDDFAHQYVSGYEPGINIWNEFYSDNFESELSRMIRELKSYKMDIKVK